MEFGTCSNGLEVKVEFLGAVAGVVTGSGTILTIRRGNVIKKILIDFGMFQGEYEYLNEERIIYPEEIDFVLLTHAHLDHCGGLPILFKSVTECDPYNGMIYGSKETLEQAKHIIMDAAKLNYRRLQSKINELNGIKNTVKKESNRLMRKEPVKKDLESLDSLNDDLEEIAAGILYLPEDAEEAIRHFEPVELNVDIPICEGIDVKFVPNSHINGSTMIEVYVSYGAERYGIAFTGDIGKRKTPLYREIFYGKEPRIDALVLESLHGTQVPQETYMDSIQTIKKILKKCMKEQKNLYIPVFALDRSAILLMVMNMLMDAGLRFNCFFDSPLGEKELVCYMSAYNSQGSQWFDYEKKTPFATERISFVSDYAEHMCLVKQEGPNVVLTSSCMGYGGRVLDYFEHHIQDEDAVFIFPGYLPDECPSKILCNANVGEIVEINGKRYIKHCETCQLHGFSSHGYLEDKLEIIERYCNAKTIFLNHGEKEAIYEMQEELSAKLDTTIIVPDFCEIHRLT